MTVNIKKANRLELEINVLLMIYLINLGNYLSNYNQLVKNKSNKYHNYRKVI